MEDGKTDEVYRPRIFMEFIANAMCRVVSSGQEGTARRQDGRQNLTVRKGNILTLQWPPEGDSDIQPRHAERSGR